MTNPHLTDPDPSSAWVPLACAAVVLCLLGLACFYFASATRSLRIVECPSVSFGLADQSCRRVMIWSRAGLGGLVAAALLALGAFSKRAR
jgi:hypothetical protein